MCIAIYKPEGKIISKATLQECYDSNPDGAGFMYNQSKKLHIEKGFFSFDSFYDAYKKHENKQAVIHFRIKTHGKIDTANCHPFSMALLVGMVTLTLVILLDSMKQYFVPLLISGAILLCFKIL